MSSAAHDAGAWGAKGDRIALASPQCCVSLMFGAVFRDDASHVYHERFSYACRCGVGRGVAGMAVKGVCGVDCVGVRACV